MNVLSFLEWAKKELAEIEPSEAKASIEVLLAEVLKVSRSELWALREKDLGEKEESLFREFIQKRKQRIPTAYILGKVFFWNEELIVNEHCLIPRPDTELLVEKLMDCTGYEKTQTFSFLDLCSGSGAIGISLLREFENSKGTFSDASKEALDVVKSNIAFYKLAGRSKVVESDLFETLSSNRFDAIVSNPPYFAERDWQLVEEEVLKEPRMAFEAGAEGFIFYERIISEAHNFLNREGWLLLEVGKGQATRVRELIEKSSLNLIDVFKDIQEIERVVVARKM